MQHAPLGRSVQQNSLGDVARDARLLQVDLGRINVGSNWVCFLNFEKSRSQILKIFQSEDFPLLLRDLYVVLSLQVFTSNNTKENLNCVQLKKKLLGLRVRSAAIPLAPLVDQ